MAARASVFGACEEQVQEKRFIQLSNPRQILIRLCQYVNFGSILNVKITDGEVSFESPPEILVDVRLDGDVPQRRELALPDFALSVETCRLLAQIDSLKNGVVEKIIVHEGFPRRVFLRRSLPLEVLP
jgi:hypothetical protein